MNEKQICKEARRVYSFESRLMLLMEECAELIQACSKMLRDGKNINHLSNFAEEVADVEIVIQQVRGKFESSIDIWKKVKLGKLLKTIEEVK